MARNHGKNYGIEASDDLLDWSELTAPISQANGNWTATLPSTLARRFLRITAE